MNSSTNNCNCITSVLQKQIKDIMNALCVMYPEAKDIHAAYFVTDATTQITAAGTGDPVTVESNLTKEEYIACITFMENLKNFFENSSVYQSNYLDTINDVIYGDAVLATQLGEATEQLGTRMKDVCTNALEVYKWCCKAYNIYVENEISAAISGMSSGSVVFGSGMIVSELTSAMTLIQQFQNMINNSAVTTGNYKATLAKWERVA